MFIYLSEDIAPSLKVSSSPYITSILFGFLSFCLFVLIFLYVGDFSQLCYDLWMSFLMKEKAGWKQIGETQIQSDGCLSEDCQLVGFIIGQEVVNRFFC